MQIVTYVSELAFSSIEEKDRVLKVMEWQSLAVNEASKTVFPLKKKGIIELHAAFYAKFRLENPEIPSQIVITAEREILARYKTCKSNKHKLKAPIAKKALNIQLDKRIYSLKKNVFSIISSEGRVKCEPKIYDKFSQYWGKYEIGDPNLFVREGKIFIAVPFKIPTNFIVTDEVVGLDLGIRNFAVSSKGMVYDDKEFKKRKRSLRFLKRNLQAAQSRSAKRHLKKLRRKERNMNKDFCHNTANTILRDTPANTLALENLKGIKKKKKRENKNSISQVPLFLFREILTYKATLKGKTAIMVNPQFTSQIDCRTGKIDGTRMGRRYLGKDGVMLDADWNAAINIAVRSKHPVSFVVPLDGTLDFSGRAKSNAQSPYNSPLVSRNESVGSGKPLPLGRGI